MVVLVPIAPWPCRCVRIDSEGSKTIKMHDGYDWQCPTCLATRMDWQKFLETNPDPHQPDDKDASE